VGQEIIARIHTYGHVNRKLVLVEVSGSGSASGATVPASGAPLFAEGEAVGRITSATFDRSAGTAIALAYLPRALASPGERLAVEKDGPPVATVVAPRGSS
jgi:aminomethyltransferase